MLTPKQPLHVRRVVYAIYVRTSRYFYSRGTAGALFYFSHTPPSRHSLSRSPLAHTRASFYVLSKPSGDRFVCGVLEASPAHRRRQRLQEGKKAFLTETPRVRSDKFCFIFFGGVAYTNILALSVTWTYGKTYCGVFVFLYNPSRTYIQYEIQQHHGLPDS